MKRTIGTLIAIAVLLGAGTAVARSTWIQEQTSASTSSTGEDGLEDPVAAPSEVADGPLSQMLAERVSAIPELAAFGQPLLKDFSEGGVEAAVVTFQAPDGAFVDVVYQELPEPLTLDSVGTPDTTRLEAGPSGEDIIIKETPYVLQVIGIDQVGRMVNLIVNRTSSDNPRAPSIHTGWSAETVQFWVVELLGATDGK